MIDDSTQIVMATWGRKNLPARVGAIETAKLLGFGEDDIAILVKTGKLKPLGSPRRNAIKWFAAVEVIRLATDARWLSDATRDVSKFWKDKNKRRSAYAQAGETADAAGGNQASS